MLSFTGWYRTDERHGLTVILHWQELYIIKYTFARKAGGFRKPAGGAPFVGEARTGNHGIFASSKCESPERQSLCESRRHKRRLAWVS